VQVKIPRTAARRSERTYVRLVLRPVRRAPFFEGALLRAGGFVEESALWPTPDYPLVPLLIEYAGSDGTGRGHNRSRDVHVLWRYVRGHSEGKPSGDFEEVARVASHGAEWVYDLRPIVERELLRPAIDHDARGRAAASRLAALIDGALDELEDAGRESALAALYNQVAARFAESVAAGAVLRESFFAAPARRRRARAA
jgi:hypothetical protein